MTARTEISAILRDPAALAGKTLRADGWVKSARNSGQVGFIDLNDGSCFASLQVLLLSESLPNYADVLKLGTGSSVSVTGVLTPSPGGGQLYELRAEAVSVYAASPPDYPLQKKRHSLEFLRGLPHLRARANVFAAVFRIRSLLTFAVHRFFQERGFVCAHTPVITTNDSEGAGEMFRVTTLDPGRVPLNADGGADFGADFFGREASLTVSGQLEAEALAHAFGKVYTFGPAFRAENSNTARHAAEFWMVEPEIAFADLADGMALAEDLVKFLARDVLTSAAAEIAFLDRFAANGLVARLESLARADFARLTYTEAVALLEKENAAFRYKARWGADLQTEHERFLTEKIFRGPVFVTDYPREIKAFYMRANDDGQTVAAMDLLVPGIGELVGGSQREERAAVLSARLAELGMPAENYAWYLDLRRYGGTPHTGFGLGFERAVMLMTGMANIRDVLPFPRTAGSAGPRSEDS
ncbi:MAG: asparagine--tRNA ligase [Gracilibacteraceae bacterium]|nr:asparagine--tRNA ligase [Gracilibacteraceae bacterium]